MKRNNLPRKGTPTISLYRLFKHPMTLTVILIHETKLWSKFLPQFPSFGRNPLLGKDPQLISHYLCKKVGRQQPRGLPQPS